MYDELVKRLWECVSGECWNCSQHKDSYDGQRTCADNLMKQAADAIENASKAYQMMAEAYEAEVAKKGWIPVMERMPEENGRYLTLYPLKTKPSVWRHKVYEFAKDLVEIDAYDFNEHKPGFYGYDGEYGYYEDKDVTHWMPLPEPPPKDGDGDV